MKKAYFVDCFNTILTRKKSPKDVLFLWCEKLSKKYGIGEDVFYKMFKISEKELRNLNFAYTNEKECKFDDILNEIKSRIAQTHICPNFDEKEFFDFAKNTYFETEFENLEVNKKVENRLRNLKKCGGGFLYI